MRQHFLKPGVYMAAGLLVLLIGAELWHLRSKDRHAEARFRASEQFGDALRRAGIETESGPSR